jgi:hypothetical protein
VRLAPAVLLAWCVLAAPAVEAGHELSFYPSYYPQEIRVETLAPGAAAAGLARGTLHAYVGGDPFGNAAVPADVRAVESLGAYLVATFHAGPAGDPGAPRWRDPAARCAAVGPLVQGLAGPDAGYVFHPYPVTPYHADYLHHADLADAARARAGTPGGAAGPPSLRIRATGPLAERVAGALRAAPGGEWDVALETVPLTSFVADHATALGGWLGPPWLKDGWFHAYLLHADALAEPGARQAANETVRRLVTGAYDGTVERLNLERALVGRLTGGCERLVLGYVPRREYVNTEFSAGIENIAADAHAGLNSAIFLRTAKLKDFPWNGWLRLGVPAGAAAAWNPVGGFSDPTGRLIWWALGDPAFFPSPRSGSWIGNRVTAPTVRAEAAIAVPRDARRPEPGTGLWREVGEGTTARTRIVYRVLASPFHDGTRMTVADTLYGLSFAYRWGAPGTGERRDYDPGVRAAVARLVDWLAGLRVVRVDASEREFGEVKFVTVTQTIEAWGRHALGDPLQTAAVTPPWSPVPWTVLVLMEEAVRRGIGAFSDAEARRLGLPWLDLVRVPKQREALAALVDELARHAHVPAALAGLVTPVEAGERWAALRDFARTRGHFLVTSGPYRLASWASDAVVLEVFRDLSYPLGVGSYDRYPIPLRAYPARVEVRGDRLEIHADVEVVQKFQREYAITREPLRTQPAALDPRDTPVARYVAVGPDGRVLAAGVAPYAGRGVFTVDLGRLPPPGPDRVLVALSVRDNYLQPEVRIVPVPRP